MAITNTDIGAAGNRFTSITQAATSNSNGTVNLSIGTPFGTETFGPNDFSDPYWYQASTIDGARWNKSFPYQLLILQANTSEDGKSTTYTPLNGFKYTLPIPPQDMKISMPFTANLQITNGGIIEEHNGAPIRNISLRCTTGVLPLKGTAGQPQSFSSLQTLFGGTISSATSFASSIDTLVNGPSNSRPNIVPDSETETGTPGAQATGYYQYRILQQFFENYAAIKKTLKGRDLRLAFAIWKDQAVYLVTPMSFDVERTSSSPYEYPYSLNLRAWKRVNLDTSDPGSSQYLPASLNPSAFQQILNKISQARDVLESASNIFGSVAGDISSVLDNLRQVNLFLNDALGVESAVADFPASIISTLKQPVLDAVTASNQLATGSTLFAGSSQSDEAALADIKASLADLATTQYNFGTNSPKNLQTNTYSPSANWSSSVNSGANSANWTGSHPAHAIFANPSQYYSLFSNMRVSPLRLPPAISQKIRNEINNVRQLTKLDFENIRDNLVQKQADYADAVGAGDATYNKIYGRPPPPITTRTPTQDDFDIIFALNLAVAQLNRLAVSGTINTLNSNILTSIEYVAGLAQKSGLAFQIPQSKLGIPFPYGSTLERLANRYLGDPDRWIEIATLNGLRSPYVDESGFDLNLLVNGSGNQVVVSDASNLFIGQPVWIQSTTTARTKRHVLSIDTTSPGNNIITVSGSANMGQYTAQAGSTLHAYLPGTVNSQMMIYIPSQDIPANPDYLFSGIPAVNQYDQLLNAGGIDLQVLSNGDAAITSNGDWKYAIGLQNLIQRIRIAFATPRGSLIRHPGFGINLIPGPSLADLTANDILKATEDLFQGDPAFTGIQSAAINLNGPVGSMALSVGIVGQNQPIAVSLDIQQ